MPESTPAAPEGEPESESESEFSSHHIETVYFDEWAPLGSASVALSLSSRCTVLVGRNGGGKSLLLEGMREGARGAFDTPLVPRSSPSRFGVDVEVNGFPFRYHYERRAAAASPRDGRGALAPAPDDWTEMCWLLMPKTALWAVKAGVLTLNTRETMHLGGRGGSLLAVPPAMLPEGWARESRQALTRVLLGMQSVQAVMPIRRQGREPITLKGGDTTTLNEMLEKLSETTANQLADALWELFEEDKEGFAELDAVGQRIGIWQKLAIEKYFKDRGRTADVLAEVTVDGINLGLVSDGTLRLLKILLALVVNPQSSAPLLIDEPELGIHPALLGRLLAEFDAYGAERQLVIATHSPQVVSWAQPDALRLVERVEGQTVVRSLSEEQAARVHSYLQDQGNLGEFVYGGGVDD